MVVEDLLGGLSWKHNIKGVLIPSISIEKILNAKIWEGDINLLGQRAMFQPLVIPKVNIASAKSKEDVRFGEILSLKQAFP